MSRYREGWAPYVPVSERRRKAAREVEKLRKKGAVIMPVKIDGRHIALTFWGKAWCDNLESYRDYQNRLERGRTYVRNGSVVDLQIAPREVTAMVSGSSLYRVRVSVGEVVKAHWTSICADCSGAIDSLVELLQGRFSKGVMERICRQGTGLFPKPSEIRFSCSCPDHASMCKHVAAVLYGVGARLDAKPELLFRLRAVNENDLLTDIGQVLPMSKREPGSGKVLETDDIAALFGLDMAGAATSVSVGGDAPAADRNAKADAPALGKHKPAKRQRNPSSSNLVALKVALAKQAARSHRGVLGGDAPLVDGNGEVDVARQRKQRPAMRQRDAADSKLPARRMASTQQVGQPSSASREPASLQNVSPKPTDQSKSFASRQTTTADVLVRKSARPFGRTKSMS